MLPKDWNDITVSQFVELQGLRSSPASSMTERFIDTILTVSDYTPEEVEDMSIKELNAVMAKLKFLDTKPPKQKVDKFGEYSVLPFNKSTWGMFIDLEYYYQKDYVKHMTDIIGIFLRKGQENTWGVFEYEPYKYNPRERGSVISHLPITSVYGVITSYLDYRNDLIDNKYKNLFTKPEDEEEVDLTGVDLVEYNKAKKEEERFNRWSYELITFNLAGQDVTKMGQVLDLSLIFVLNMLSMQSDLKL